MNARSPKVLLTGALLASGLAITGCARKAPLSDVDATTPFAARASTNAVLIGEVFTLTATVAADADQTIEWPVPGAPPALWVRNSREENLAGPPARRVRHWELIALRPGRHLVWTGAVSVARADETTWRTDVPRMEIAVLPTLNETNNTPRDIAGLQHWPTQTWKRVLLAVASVAVLAALAGLLVHSLRRREKQTVKASPLPPHEQALRALRAVRARGWPEADGVEAFYVEVSAIVRRYLEDAFSLRAPEQTTEEFIRTATTSSRLTLDHQQLVIAFLEQCDLVKFARYQPAQADMEAALAAAERLVNETIPAPPPGPAPLRPV
ncbi:MAG TPA: hypothetical protein PKE12_05720 [Kiritimatiellia bacterium]|nr:hypothetical protein [Kiritimatiellia bacterium]